MAKFITLTESPSGNKLIVRVDYVIYISKSQKKDDTYIRYAVDLNLSQNEKNGGWFFVKETVDEVEDLLCEYI